MKATFDIILQDSMAFFLQKIVKISPDNFFAKIYTVAEITEFCPTIIMIFSPTISQEEIKLGTVMQEGEKHTLQMFCLLNPQMNACEPNPKTTSSNFNR